MASSNAYFHQPYDPNYAYHHHHHPPPQQHSYAFNEDQGINTLFVSGLPDDVKPREIHNLFRRRPGFDFCQLKYTGRGNQVVAFATFFNNPSAIAAMHTLNGALFDPQTGASLHIELARSNSRPKRLRGGEAYFVIDKRVKATPAAEETSNDGDDGSDEPSGTSDSKSSNQDDLASAESGETKADADSTGAAVNDQTETPAGGDVRPCSTLFIANLGPNCTESELKQALSQYPGFHTVKMRANRGMPVAFADYEEVEQATEALQGLQGSLLPSSDRGGLHIEYARSKMRKS